jgi:hypothetical protein
MARRQNYKRGNMEFFNLPNGCFQWLGSLDKDGYAVSDGQRVARMFWEAQNGALPAGQHLHHICHNRDCVRPTHCEPRTKLEHRRLHLKTVCKNGHLFTPDGTGISRDRKHPEGWRRCLICHRERARQRRLYGKMSAL